MSFTDADIEAALSRSARAMRRKGVLAQQNGKSAQGNGTRFAIGQPPQGNPRPYYQVPFAEGVKNAIDPAQKNTFRSPIFVRQTPEPFLQIGFPALPMMTNVRKARLNYYTESEFVKYFGSLRPNENAHGLHDNYLKVKEALAHPIAIMANLAPNAQSGSVMAITDININGKKVIVPVEIAAVSRGDGLPIDAHLVLTVYDKNDWMANVVKPALEAEKTGVGVFYLDKEKAGRYGVFSQLKERVPSGIIHNINDPKSPVKGVFKKQTETSQFQRWFGKSVVKDANGDPLVVYHDTNAKIYVNKETGENWDELDWKAREEWEARDDWDEHWEERDFYTFSRVRARRSIEYPGFFFSPKADPYHEYGSRRIAAYLSIQNPAINPTIENAGVYDDSGEAAMKKLIEQGYDGVIRTDENGNVEEYIAFYPEQIKSATDNVGTFDPNNPDVRYSIDDGAGFVEPKPFTSGIDDSRGKNIVAMLRPIVGKTQLGLDKDQLSRNLKERYGVDVSPAEAWIWANEAVRLNRIEHTRRLNQVRDEWLYENNLLWKQAVDYAGSPDFKVRVSDHMSDRELSGTFWLRKGDEKKYTGTVIDLDALANEVARQQSRDALDVEQEFFDFFNGLDKQQELAGDKAQARRDKEEWMRQEKFRIEDEVVRIIEVGQPVTLEWALENRKAYEELYRRMFDGKEAPRNVGKADLEAINAALTQAGGDASSFAEAYKAAREKAYADYMEKMRAFRDRVMQSKADAVKLQREALDFAEKNLPPELRGEFARRIVGLLELPVSPSGKYPEGRRMHEFQKLLADMTSRRNDARRDEMLPKIDPRPVGSELPVTGCRKGCPFRNRR